VRKCLEIQPNSAALTALVWLAEDRGILFRVAELGVEEVAWALSEDAQSRELWWVRVRDLPWEVSLGAVTRACMSDELALSCLATLGKAHPRETLWAFGELAGLMPVGAFWACVEVLLEAGVVGVVELYSRASLLAQLQLQLQVSGVREVCLRLACSEGCVRGCWSEEELRVLSELWWESGEWPWSARREAAVLELSLAETLPEDVLRRWWVSRGAEASSTLLLLEEVVSGVAVDEEVRAVLRRLAGAAADLPGGDWLLVV
jgi:hypothetical protein